MSTEHELVETGEDVHLALHRTIGDIRADDVAEIFDELSPASLDAVVRYALPNKRLQRRFMPKEQQVRVLLSSLRRDPVARQTIVDAVVSRYRDILQEATEDPTPEQVESSTERVLERTPASLVQLTLIHIALSDAPASEHCQKLAVSRFPHLFKAEEIEQDQPNRIEQAQPVLDAELEVVTTSVKQQPVVEQESSTQEPNAVPEHLFSRHEFAAIDRMLIREAVATASKQYQSFNPQDMCRVVEEVVRLNGARALTWFHVGFLQGLEIAEQTWLVADPSLNAERRTCAMAGRLQGWARRGDGESLERAVINEWNAVLTVYAEPFLGAPTIDWLLSHLIQTDASKVAEILNSRTMKFHTGKRGAHSQLEFLGQLRDVINSEAELSHRKWAERSALELVTMLMKRDDASVPHVAAEICALVLTTSRVRRQRREFSESQAALAAIDLFNLEGLSPESRSDLYVERAMVGLHLSSINDLQLPKVAGTDNLAYAFLSKHTEFIQDVETALEWDSNNPKALLLLGAWLYCSDIATDIVRGLECLERALEHFEADESDYKFIPQLQRLVALAMLDRDEPQHAHIASSLAAKAVARRSVFSAVDLYKIVDRLTNLGKLDDPDIADQVVEVVRHAKSIPLEVGTILASNILMLDVLLEFANRVPLAERFDVFQLALDTAINASEERLIERLFDKVDELVFDAGNSLDGRWSEEFLNPSSAVHRYLGEPFADVRGLYILAQTQPTPVMLTRIVELLDRLQRDRSPYLDFTQVFALLEQNCDPSTYAEYVDYYSPHHKVQRLPTVSERQIALLFYGGDETQAHLRSEVDARVQREFSGSVSVEWVFPGWGSNWMPAAERARASFPQFDALVLMPMVRTNAGRFMRREAGAAGLPWIPCTGNGQDSVFRAIAYATNLVRSRSY